MFTIKFGSIFENIMKILNFENYSKKQQIMIRNLIFITLLGFFNTVIAQQSYTPVNIKSLEKQISKSDQDISNPKKNIKAPVWIKRGELMHKIYNIDIDQVFDGMDVFSLKLFYKDPKSTTTTEIQGYPTTVYEYERIKYFFQDERLRWWEKTETLVDDPLSEAYKAFTKALEIDQKGTYDEKLKQSLVTLKSFYRQSGLNEYFAGNAKKGLSEILMVNKINELKFFKNELDTMMIQYSGIIAREIGDYKTAAEQYHKLLELNLGNPNTYLLLKEDYLAMQDTAKAISILEDGFSVFPDSVNLVSNLIDLYMRTDEIDKGLQKIEESIKSSSEKGELYYWKGRLMLNKLDDESNKVDNVIEVYQTALKYNPELYYVYYDIGFIYFMQGQELFTQAGGEKDSQRRALLNKVATEKFNEAIPVLNNAIKYNESNVAIKIETYDTLRRIYYRLQMNDKYEEVNKALKELRN